jgi:hypothetical protein
MGFGGDVKSWSHRIKGKKDEIISLSFKRLATLIINRTPIGDVSIWLGPAPEGYRPGTLVNNWFAGVGEAPTPPLRGPNVTGADSLSQINAAALIAPGKLMYITNPTPYGRRIEFGSWSSQAPTGMVRVSVRDFQLIVKKAIQDVR